jgi:polyisoprenoid-binding protein YceI
MLSRRNLVVSLVTVLASAALAPAARAADEYQIDPVHSVIIFRIGHMDAGVFYGRFNSPTGSFTWDEQSPAASRFQAQVKAADFDSGNEKRDQHVRGPDFLSAKEFPTIGFKSTSVKPADGTRFQVAGELTLHGVTKPVTVMLEKIGSAGNRTGFEGVTELKRSDFGIKGIQGVADQVRLIIAFEGVKK